MKLCRMVLSVQMQECGEAPEEAPEPVKFSSDPVNRVADMVEQAFKAARPFATSEPASTLGITRSYDVPVSDFAEATDVLRQFDAFALKIGIPSNRERP